MVFYFHSHMFYLTQGNKRMLITFHEGTRFSNDSIIQAVFRGSEGTHAVRAEQVNRFTHSVLIPG